MSAGIEKHWKTAELAERLGLSPKTLRRAALRGEVSAIRIGGDLIWPESAVQAWLERNREDNSAGGTVVPLHTRASTTRRTA